MATLKDVARDAGVSIATVSCCLSGSKPVKAETRLKIMDSIQKLKYIPNDSARSLKKSKTNQIGIILTDMDSRYHAEIFKGISDQLQRKGYVVRVTFSNDNPSLERQLVEDYISQNVSGLILFTSMPTNTSFFQNRLFDFNIPTVFIDRKPEELETSFVGFNATASACHLTKCLLDCGYRKIALVTGPASYSSEKDSIRGFEQAFERIGLSSPENLIQSAHMSKESAFKTALTYLDLTNLDAIITTSQSMTQGILEALHVRGLIPGKDIQLLSFGESSWDYSSIPAGTIRTNRPAFQLGCAAADLLLNRIRSIKNPCEEIIMEDEIIHQPLIFPAPTKISKNACQVTSKTKPLRMLLVDLHTAHGLQLLAGQFTAATGIPIEITIIPHDQIFKAITKDMQENRHYYDIYMYDVPWLPFLVQNEYIADISSYYETSPLPQQALFEHNIDNCCHDEKFYGLPLVSGAQVLFYRKDIFEDYAICKEYRNHFHLSLRPPKTWSEFNHIAEFFTRSNNHNSPTMYGTSVAGKADEELAPEILIRLWANGGSLWNPYKKATLNTPENKQGYLQFLEVLNSVEHSPLDTSIAQTVNDFSNGKTAMLVTYTEYTSEIIQSLTQQIIGQVGYHILPGKTPVSIGWNLGLSPDSGSRKDAYLFFDWLCQTETSYYMTILDGQSAVKAPYHNYELQKLYPWLELTEQSFPYCKKRIGPYEPKSLIIPQNKLESILCKVVKDVLNKGMDLDLSLKKRQTEMEAMFHSYGYPKPMHFI